MIKLKKIIYSPSFLNWLLIPLLACLFFEVSFIFFTKKKSVDAESLVSQIKTESSLKSQVKLYEKLIKKIGPEQAQDELYRSGLPFTGQTHLLNHVVGDFLYKKYGTDGLKYCRDYFLSSCHHGFMLNAIAAGGISKVAETFSSCAKTGSPVAVQCSHAIGHGFLASIGYTNLTEALKKCDQVAGDIKDFPLFNCYDGVFMENIWGVHNGSPSPDRWIKTNDPIYPCNDKRIVDKYKLGCWSNQPTLMYQLFKGDIKKVGRECDKLPDKEFKKMCFDGLSRQINPLTAGNLDKVFDLCGLLPVAWKNFCVSNIASGFFGNGDRELPFAICNRLAGTSMNECYDKLLGTIKSNDPNPALCDKINDSNWRVRCRQ
jgi:hypothetical protein